MEVVMIEWDGDKPPTTWYNRLHRQFGLYVRGDKDKSPVHRREARREMYAGSVIIQEGTILCSSPSLARELATLALEQGAKVVKIGTVDPQDFYATTEDIKVHDRIESLAGARGRPHGELMDFSILCLEEMKVYKVEDVRYVTVCPGCGATHIKTFVGEADGYMWPAGDENFRAWVRTRFANGEFIVPSLGVKQPPEEIDFATLPQRERDALRTIQDSQDFLIAMNKIGAGVASRIFDAVFSSRAFERAVRRKEMRIEAAVLLLQDGRAIPGEIPLSENPTKVDVIDAASILGPKLAGELWYSTKGAVAQ